MKKEVAKAWVEALRSGKYKQGKGWLRQEEPGVEPTFCCLGVLCDLSGQGRWKESAGSTSWSY